MNIKYTEIYKIRLPYLTPFTTGFGTLTEANIVFVKLFDETGFVGLGEATNIELPLYEPEFNDGMILLLKQILIPSLLHKKIETIEDLQNTYSRFRGNNLAKIGIEAAFWHIESQRQNKPLRYLWGGVKEKIPVAISIGLADDLTKSIEKVKRYIETYKPKRVKIKIRPGIDIEYVQQIRKMYPDLPLMVDANASYTLQQISILKKLDTFGLLMIEQPLEYNDIVDHAYLQKELKTPICLDESISGFHAAEESIKIGACKIINIKPQRVGGYWQAKLISELANKNQISVWCGGMIESGWGQLFNCNIATLPNYTYENDICLTKWYMADDILNKPISEKDGIIDVSSTDNLFSIDEKKFKRYTIEKIVIK